MIPDLSDAVCYYRTRRSRWVRVVIELVFISASAFGTYIGIDEGAHWYQIIGSHRGLPFFFMPLLTLLTFSALMVDLPGVLYSGPTIAITKDGVWIEFATAKLILIEWRDIAFVQASEIRNRYGNTSYRVVEIYPKDIDLLFSHVEERSGKLPFFVNLRYTFTRSTKPIRIMTGSIENGTREEIANKIATQLLEFQQSTALK